MRRTVQVHLAALLPLLLVAGCEAGGGLPPGPPAPTAHLKVGFGGLVDTVAIDAVERLPLRSAELIAPDGAATPASTIDVVDAPRFAAGQQVAGDQWRNALSGNGGAAAATATPGAALLSQQQLLAVASTAEITLPDPVAYRRDWAQYRIRLTFGTPPGEVETRELAAPAPPPG